MPLPPLDDRQYLEKQYRDSSNLQARINIHNHFSVNKYGWHLWIFDHFELPPRCRILELGCGPGYLWLENISRIPHGWDITLSDASAGMLETARQNLAAKRHFQFKVIDAQSIPCENASFDAVIANHMLYHVPDRSAAFSEICRVLRPDGHFYTTTVGDRHLIEIGDLIRKFDASRTSWGRDTESFTLDNGMAQLSPWFKAIKLYRYEDSLEVTEAAPLADYIFSGREYVPVDRRPLFRDFLARELKARGGVIHITKDSGLFASVPDGKVQNPGGFITP